MAWPGWSPHDVIVERARPECVLKAFTMRWLHSATAEASALGLGRFNFVTVQRSDTTRSQAALPEFIELYGGGSTGWEYLRELRPGCKEPSRGGPGTARQGHHDGSLQATMNVVGDLKSTSGPSLCRVAPLRQGQCSLACMGSEPRSPSEGVWSQHSSTVPPPPPLPYPQTSSFNIPSSSLQPDLSLECLLYLWRKEQGQ
ncbi:unnamed protein product [Pleuronectes platessa]|uniref:Uncharacterized protein n=1 Tax=Pleuronectes platessa TaxID=8262 RepID=A0A9N7URI9_PLEPL|nr:unnamed protein product [Pleuronectes platessa]